MPSGVLGRAVASVRYRASKRRIATSPYRIFSVAGGSGSTHLVRMLQRSGRVCVRPDTQWLPPVLGEPARPQLDARRADQAPLTNECLMRQYDFDMVVSDYRDFTARCNGLFVPSVEATIEQNLVRLCREANERGFFVTLNSSAQMSLFSRNGVRRVVFLFRHPLDAYLSLFAPERHPELAEALGGVEAEHTIRAQADVWNRRAHEYLRCVEAGLDPLLVRFEHSSADTAGKRGLSTLFGEVQPRPRRSTPGDVDRLLRSLVEENFSRIYAREW